MIVLDTHAWVWWAGQAAQIPVAVRRRIARSARIGLCAISVWEVAMLVSKERLELSLNVDVWLDKALRLPRLELLPLTPEVAVESCRLPGVFHADPADRMIVATARLLGAPLVTKDRRIHAWGQVRAVW